ncbi:MAG: hypothetical protein Q9227_001973 [Pyrenula ochraceoflavens]
MLKRLLSHVPPSSRSFSLSAHAPISLFQRRLSPSPLRRSLASISAADLRFGQPVYETHPHVLKAGELTPGISALEYAQRRSKLAAKLPKNSIAIVAATDIKYRSNSTFYEFRQDSDFFYLTGFNEPAALAVIGKTSDQNDHTLQLFVREKEEKAEIWEGARSGTQAAIDVFNADEAYDVTRIQDVLPRIVGNASQVYTELTQPTPGISSFTRFLYGAGPQNKAVADVLQSSKVRSLRPVVNDLRVLKSEAEIRAMRKAGQAAGRAHTKAMAKSFTLEKDLDAFLEYQLRLEGCDSAAFEPVVAGGANALSIHYVRNDDAFRHEELVLVDCGGEYGNYISDITRTWPMNGRFTGPQHDLYEAVLRCQRSCISMCRESASVTLDQLHDIAETALKDQLKQLGFDMSGGAIQTLFPHHLGHYIGIDVHDTPGYSRGNKLEAGNCVTIEPGLYIPFDDRWPKHFQGLGIRIEDSICVQQEHPYNLTAEAVKEVVDIENLRS